VLNAPDCGVPAVRCQETAETTAMGWKDESRSTVGRDWEPARRVSSSRTPPRFASPKAPHDRSVTHSTIADGPADVEGTVVGSMRLAREFFPEGDNMPGCGSGKKLVFPRFLSFFITRDGVFLGDFGGSAEAFGRGMRISRGKRGFLRRVFTEGLLEGTGDRIQGTGKQKYEC
jgi:hypothetical protein